MRSANSFMLELRDERLAYLSIGVFYIVTRERSAWWGYESRIYQGPTSLTVTLDAAKQVAENWRQRGSQFTIQEIPGLVIETELSRVVLVEFHSDNSFGKWDRSKRDVLRNGTPARQLLGALGPLGYWRGEAPSEWSFVSGLLEAGDSEKEVKPRTRFRAWVSEFFGATEPIWWSQEKGRHKSAGVRAIRTEYVDVNGLDPTPIPSTRDSSA